jgi:hypothetical protein
MENKVKFASVKHGALVIELPDMYAELMTPPSASPKERKKY